MTPISLCFWIGSRDWKTHTSEPTHIVILIFSHIEKACGDVQEFSLTVADSIRSMSSSLQALGTADPKSEEACMFGAHVRNLDMEYGKWVKAKLVRSNASE